MIYFLWEKTDGYDGEGRNFVDAFWDKKDAEKEKEKLVEECARKWGAYHKGLSEDEIKENYGDYYFITEETVK